LPIAVSTSDGTASIFTLTSTGFSPATTLTVTTDGSTAETVAFSPQGTLLAAGGDDGFLNFWNVPVTAASASSPDIDIVTATADFSDWVDVIAFSPDGSYIALGAGFFGSITGWNAASSRSQVGVEYDSSYDMTSLAYSGAGVIAGGEADCGCVVVCHP
jgi:WD40 repeat protein